GREQGIRGRPVSRQLQALPHLTARCVEAHPDCGIRLQGSVARGQERLDSDIDLIIVVPEGGLQRPNELLCADNHWSMQLVHDAPTGMKLDINWVTAPEL